MVPFARGGGVHCRAGILFGSGTLVVGIADRQSDLEGAVGTEAGGSGVQGGLDGPGAGVIAELADGDR